MLNKIALLGMFGGQRFEFVGTINLTVGASSSGQYIGYTGIPVNNEGTFGNVSLLAGDLYIVAFYHWYGNDGNSPITVCISNLTSEKIKIQNAQTGVILNSAFSDTSAGVTYHYFFTNPFEGIAIGETCPIIFFA